MLSPLFEMTKCDALLTASDCCLVRYLKLLKLPSWSSRSRLLRTYGAIIVLLIDNPDKYQKSPTEAGVCAIMSLFLSGALAHLVERFHGNVEDYSEAPASYFCCYFLKIRFR